MVNLLICRGNSKWENQQEIKDSTLSSVEICWEGWTAQGAEKDNDPVVALNKLAVHFFFPLLYEFRYQVHQEKFVRFTMLIYRNWQVKGRKLIKKNSKHHNKQSIFANICKASFWVMFEPFVYFRRPSWLQRRDTNPVA